MEVVRKPRNQWPALGTLLLRDGAVTETQLERALELQRAQPERRLGEILTEQGFVDPGAISRVLAEQHELTFVDLHTRAVDQTAALLLPEPLARRYRALLIEFLEDGALLVAVADPTNVMFSDDLRLAVGMPVRICVSPPDSIEAAITSVNDVGPIEELVTSLRDEDDDASILDLHHNTPAVVFVNKSISSALDVGASDISVRR